MSLLLILACREPHPSPVDPAEPADTDDTADTAATDETAETADPIETGSAPGGWNGAGAYRVRIRVPGYDPGGRVDQGPAAVSLDLGAMLDLLGAPGEPDPATLQVVREADDGTPLAPARRSPTALGAWDTPFRFSEQLLEAQGFVFNPASASAHGTLSFVHLQDGAGDTRYSVYFDVATDPAPISSPRPALGDADMLYEAEGWLGTMIHTRPFLVDLDGDGLLDLVTGDSLGYVTLYRNGGTAAAPSWANGEWLRTATGPIQPGLLSIPDVVDWDGDGDLDLLVGSETGAIITFYANMGGLLFEDRGTLQADGAQLRAPPEPCAELDFFTVDYTSAPEAVDVDADGDLDLLVGGYVTGHIFVFENTRDAPGEPTLVRSADLTADGAPIDTWWSASPATVDLDGDGDLDLVSGTMNWEPTDDERRWWPWVFYWENTGSGYTEVPLPMTDELPITRGNLTGARPGDIDGDGDADLVLAADSRVYVLRNVGDAENPLFQPEDPLPLPWTPLLVSADAQPVDLDADGDLDLARGGGASVSWTENLGDADPPTFEGHGSLAAGGVEIAHFFDDGDDTSFPVFFDWDGDLDLDLVMGTGDGLVWLYLNEGTLVTEDLAPGRRLALSDGTLLHVGEDRPPEDFEGHSGDRAQPAAADLDGDGDTDLLVGDAYGSVTMFLNDGTDAFGDGEVVLHYSDDRAAPSVADWDGDGDPDLILGQAGGIWLYPNVGGDGFVLGEVTYVSTPNIYSPHPWAADFNGDGDLDLLVSSSYYYEYFLERTWIEGGTRAALVEAVEDIGGARADATDRDAWAWEADAPFAWSWPAWTAYPDSGAVSGGIATLSEGQGAYLGTLFSGEGGFGWAANQTTEVEVRLRVLSLDAGRQSSLTLAVSDGSANWHLRWAPGAVSFYGYDARTLLDTTEWHTWRVAMAGDALSLCRDDAPGTIVSSPPSLVYTRNAMWIGDDDGATGGTSEIDWIRWTFAGDGDPCTGW